MYLKIKAVFHNVRISFISLPPTLPEIPSHTDYGDIVSLTPSPQSNWVFCWLWNPWQHFIGFSVCNKEKSSVLSSHVSSSVTTCHHFIWVSPLQFPVSFCFENFSGRENWRLQCWRHWSLWHYSSMEVRGLSLSQPELLVSPARYSGQLSIWYQSRWRGGGGRETEISINKAEPGFIWSTSLHSSGAGTMFWHL